MKIFMLIVTQQSLSLSCLQTPMQHLHSYLNVLIFFILVEIMIEMSFTAYYHCKQDVGPVDSLLLELWLLNS